MIMQIDYFLLLMSKIDELNKIKDKNKRLSDFILFQNKFYSDFNDEANELFAKVDLSSKNTNGKSIKEQVNDKVNQLSLGLDDEMDSAIAKDILLDYIEKECNNLDWYEQNILKLYIKLGTYRSVGEHTGIPFASIYKTVQKVFNEIREKKKL